MRTKWNTLIQSIPCAFLLLMSTHYMTDGTGTGPSTESFLNVSPMVTPYLDLIERARGMPTSIPCAFVLLLHTQYMTDSTGSGTSEIPSLSSVESSAGGILFFTWFTLVTYSAQRHYSLGRVHFKAIPFI